MDAKTFFNKRGVVARSPYRRNEFGGNVGGPVVADKLFYFAGYQGIRFTQPLQTVSTIPTQSLIQQMSAGDFMRIGTQIYDPYSLPARRAPNPFQHNPIPV